MTQPNEAHDQLTELERLMRRLRIWPSKLHYCDGTYGPCGWYLLHTSNPLPNQYTLAIVTDRAEKELVDRGWSRGPRQLTMYGPDTDGNDITLADALRAEIGGSND